MKFVAEAKLNPVLTVSVHIARVFFVLVRNRTVLQFFKNYEK